MAMEETKALPSPQTNNLDLVDSKPPAKPHFWYDAVEPKRTDLLLLACCFVVGLTDTSSFHNWATFVSMQTGNTIILCLSTAGYPAGQPYAFATTLISIVAFFLGGFVTTRVSNIVGAKRRIVLSTNFLFQAILITVAAALATSSILITDQHHGAHGVLDDARILIAIGPLAFQSGATIATSRLVGYGNEIPCCVYTSTFAALAADPKLFHLHGNAPRNRRVAAVIAVFSGAFVATWLEKASVGAVATFWMAAGIKYALAAAVCLLPQKQPQLAAK
ncbi:hypothetical protein K431DRAFT_336154 [Polychaeton citri CBS 116435]|uniref:DUF1275 domain protein n=1 Tax=Polychaeton citri CBS 116435 TaxID=1314669 RepID=A0A9P4URI4_9PEZI|nr:hypothetical protein K431DRAFT_336154 [Polychaeton citri CBS 116435]